MYCIFVSEVWFYKLSCDSLKQFCYFICFMYPFSDTVQFTFFSVLPWLKS